MGGDLVRTDVALFAGAMAGEAPEVRAVIDIENDLAAVRRGDARSPCSARRPRSGRAKWVPVTTTAAAEAMKASSMSSSREPCRRSHLGRR